MARDRHVTHCSPGERGAFGRLVEMNPTRKVFSNPDEEATEAYISGRFG